MTALAAAHPSGAGSSHWVQDWRRPMLRFAQLHLSPAEEAEDAVQEALLAFWEHRDHARCSANDAKRYLFGILKHKITDRLRRKYRPAQGLQDPFVDEADAALFDAAGHWQFGITRWSRPDDELHTQQFFAVVDICIHRLPAKPARVFSMKAFLDCEPDDICATLALTKTD